MASRNSSAATPLSPQSGARAAVPNPTSRAGGQDDLSLDKLHQIIGKYIKKTGFGCLWRFWCPLGLLFAALGPPGDPMGSLGNPSGLPWGSLGDPMGSLGGPSGSLGRPLGVPWSLGVNRAIFSDLSKIGRPIPSKCVYLHAPAHKKWPRGIHPRQPADPPKVAQGPPFPTPLLAPGARMT